MIGLGIVLLIVIAVLLAYVKVQINSAGMTTKGFYDFVKANINIQKVANFAKAYDGLTSKEQLVFIEEAKEIFDAFENVPTMLWEEEFDKYTQILEKYQKIKTRNWKHGVSEERFIEILEEMSKKEEKEKWLRENSIKEKTRKALSLNLAHAKNKLKSKLKDDHGHINIEFINLCFSLIFVIILIKMMHMIIIK